MPCQSADMSLKFQGRELGSLLKWVRAGSLEGRGDLNEEKKGVSVEP